MFTYKDDYKEFKAVKLNDDNTIIDLDNRLLRAVSKDGTVEKHGVDLDSAGLDFFSNRDQELIKKHR